MCLACVLERDPVSPRYRTPSRGPGGDIFVRKLSPSGVVIYSVYFGGAGSETGAGIAVSNAGYVYVVGTTTSYTASKNIFVAKLNQAGSALLYNVHFGGSGDDTGNGIAIDGAGNAYVTGSTDSTNFPTTAGTFQPARRGWTDAVVAKLNPAGNALVYATYLGGDGWEEGNAIAVDSSFNAYVTGYTSSINFPTTFGALRTSISAGRISPPSRPRSPPTEAVRPTRSR